MMNRGSLQQLARKMLPSLLGLGLFLAFFIAVLPHHVLIRDDDFGYILSITDSIARGRIVTNNWLAPLAGTNTAASILIFYTTGSFYLATYGALTLYACLCFMLLYLNFRPHLPRLLAAELTFLFVLCPIIFNKLVDFTASAQGWVLFLTAILAFRRNNLFAFTILAVLAFADRQNYVGLFAMPCATIVLAYIAHRKLDFRASFYVAAGLICCFAVARGIPDNFYRATMTPSLRSIDPLPLFTNGITYLYCFLFFFTFGSFLIRGSCAFVRRPSSWEITFWIVASIFLLVMYFGDGKLINFEAAPFFFLRPPLSLCIVPVFIAGAFFAPLQTLLKKPLVWAVAVIYAISSLNPSIWDYYMVEAALAGLIIAAGEDCEVPPARLLKLGWLYIMACVAWLIPFAGQIRKAEFQTVAYENLLRSHVISVREIPRSNFGYCQYKLFDYGVFQRQHPQGHVAMTSPDCGTYLGGTTVLLKEDNLSTLPESTCRKIVAIGGAKAALFASKQTAFRCSANAPTSDIGSGFYERPFPLNDAEWRRMIRENVLAYPVN